APELLAGRQRIGIAFVTRDHRDRRLPVAYLGARRRSGEIARLAFARDDRRQRDKDKKAYATANRYHFGPAVVRSSGNSGTPYSASTASIWGRSRWSVALRSSRSPGSSSRTAMAIENDSGASVSSAAS